LSCSKQLGLSDEALVEYYEASFLDMSPKGGEKADRRILRTCKVSGHGKVEISRSSVNYHVD